MRIAIASWTRRKAGGVETYLGGVIPELHRVARTVAFWHEIDEPSDRETIALPDGVASWCVSKLGAERALAALRDWQPDLIYTHGLHDAQLEARIIRLAPTVFFAHAYYGTCISGGKTFKNPVAQPCSRRFGWQCLLRYYPRRCGGLSPVTMLKQFEHQSKRLGLSRQYSAIITNSDHMKSEYIKHGLDAGRVHKLSFPVGIARRPEQELMSVDYESVSARTTPYLRLLFLGRMDFLKGGRILIDALPLVRASLDRPLRVTFAGDGPDRQMWERQAASTQAQNEGLQIEFAGWVQGQQRESLLAECDLLVMPSLWPEPFGLSGPEAGLRGVPVAAFDVGGISEWLIDGVNGYLAPGDPPTAAGLAQAIIKCLRDSNVYARLRRGAIEEAQRFSMENHMSALLKVFERIARQ